MLVPHDENESALLLAQLLLLDYDRHHWPQTIETLQRINALSPYAALPSHLDMDDMRKWRAKLDRLVREHYLSQEKEARDVAERVRRLLVDWERSVGAASRLLVEYERGLM